MRLLLALGLLISAAPALAQPPAPRRIDDFARLPFMEGPELSPDGTKMAAKVAVNGVQRLMIVPLANMKDMRLINFGDNDLNWWDWVNDEWLITGVGATTSVQGDDWYLRRLVGVSADGTQAKPIGWREAAQGADDVLWIARDGTPRILFAMQRSAFPSEPEFWPQVYEVDVSTAKLKRVVSGEVNVMDWYADAAGTVRMGIGYNDVSRTSRLLYREKDGTSFRTIDRARSGRDEELTVPAMFLAEPGKALAYDSKDGFSSLYELDLATLAIGKKVFGAEGYDIGGLFRDTAGTGLAGVSYVADAPKVHWLDPELDTIQKDMDKAVGQRRARIVSFNRDRSKMLVHVGGPDRAGAYYFMDRAVGTLQLITYASDKLKNVALAPVKTFRYAARDGLQIPAVLTLPAGREAKNLPLIVMPHGGPAARDSETFDWWSQFLADRGYAVVQPNYRGSTGLGTEFAGKGEGEWGLKMQDDLNDAVAELAKQGVVDAKRVCMVGGSYGGYAALRAAQRDGGQYRCAVSFAGVSDLGHLARTDQRSLYGNSYKASLKEKAPDFRAVSPINYPEQFSAPVLLVHGKKDLRVPVSQSRQMADKLRKAGKTVEYVEQKEGDHFFSREQDRLEFLKLLETFLAKHNPA